MGRRTVLVALVTLLVASTAAFFPPDRCAEPLVRVAPDGSRHFAGGELRYVENIPFLRLTGGYYEMGYQYGVLMRKELQEAFRSYNLLRASILGQIPLVCQAVRPAGPAHDGQLPMAPRTAEIQGRTARALGGLRPRLPRHPLQRRLPGDRQRLLHLHHPTHGDRHYPRPESRLPTALPRQIPNCGRVQRRRQTTVRSPSG